MRSGRNPTPTAAVGVGPTTGPSDAAGVGSGRSASPRVVPAHPLTAARTTRTATARELVTAVRRPHTKGGWPSVPRRHNQRAYAAGRTRGVVRVRSGLVRVFLAQVLVAVPHAWPAVWATSLVGLACDEERVADVRRARTGPKLGSLELDRHALPVAACRLGAVDLPFAASDRAAPTRPMDIHRKPPGSPPSSRVFGRTVPQPWPYWPYSPGRPSIGWRDVLGAVGPPRVATPALAATGTDVVARTTYRHVMSARLPMPRACHPIGDLGKVGTDL